MTLTAAIPPVPRLFRVTRGVQEQTRPLCDTCVFFKMRDDIEFNIQFCEEIEKYPCLYDYSRSDYCNRSAQDQAWQKIAKKFGVQGKL